MRKSERYIELGGLTYKIFVMENVGKYRQDA